MTRLFGKHAIEDLLDQAPDALAAVVYAPRPDPATTRLLERAQKAGIPIREVAPELLRESSGSRGGSAIAADVRLAPAPDLRTLRPDHAPLLIALDQVTDPHNLGAILRSAAAFSASAVIVPRDGSAPLNDAAIRASAGGAAHVPVLRVTNLARALGELHDQGYWPCAVTGDAPANAWRTDLASLPLVLVLGAEGTGLRPLVRKACMLAVKLPIAGRIQSLNVSVAAGIILAEVARQRASTNLGEPSQRGL